MLVSFVGFGKWIPIPGKINGGGLVRSGIFTLRLFFYRFCWSCQRFYVWRYCLRDSIERFIVITRLFHVSLCHRFPEISLCLVWIRFQCWWDTFWFPIWNMDLIWFNVYGYVNIAVVYGLQVVRALPPLSRNICCKISNNVQNESNVVSILRVFSFTNSAQC